MTTPAETVDLDINQGETKVFTATWTVDGAPKPLTGFVAHMQMRKRAGSFGGTPLMDLRSNGANPAIEMEPDGVTGKVRVRIPAQLTAALTKDCFFDLFVINASDPSESVRLVAGKAIISRSATDNSNLDLTINTPDLAPLAAPIGAKELGRG